MLYANTRWRFRDSGSAEVLFCNVCTVLQCFAFFCTVLHCFALALQCFALVFAWERNPEDLLFIVHHIVLDYLVPFYVIARALSSAFNVACAVSCCVRAATKAAMVMKVMKTAKKPMKKTTKKKTAMKKEMKTMKKTAMKKTTMKKAMKTTTAKKKKKKGQQSIGADAQLLFPPFSDWIRELWNSRFHMRALMHPQHV